MAHIGVFRREGWDAGAYAVALIHAQEALAGSPHRLSLHTFRDGELPRVADAANDVEALLVFGAEGAELDYLRAASRPSLVCERVVEGCNYIAPDNEDMGRTAAQHLLDHGHTELAVVVPGTAETVGAYHGTRLRGFRQAAEESGHPVSEDNVLFGAKGWPGGLTAAESLLARSELPEALYVQNLPMGLSTLKTLREGGVQIPDDLSLVSTTFAQLNAVPATDHTTPPLTCVTFAKEEMGRRGVEYLVAVVHGHTAEPLQVLLPGILIERASTVRAKAAV